MSRKILNNVFVAKGVAPADKFIYDLENNASSPNNIVFFNPRTGKTLGPGITYQTNPEIAIAQAMDLDGDNMVDALRKRQLDGKYIFNVTTDTPRSPISQIKNAYWRCTSKDTEYGLNIGWRNHDTLLTQSDNQFAFKTVSVNLSDYTCSSCDDGLDCKEVSCAMHRAFYAKGLDAKDSLFMRRSLEVQNKTVGVDLVAIMDKEVQYCLSAFAGACGSCNEISAVTGITIVADPTKLDANGNPFLATNFTKTFPGTLVPGSTTNSYYGQLERIVKLINKAFEEAGVTGHAVAIEGIKGTARPCDPINILINSCYSVILLNGTGAAITPCIPEYNPFAGKSFTNQTSCIGCSAGSTFVPNCGVRAIGKPIKIDKTCLGVDQRIMWYFTEVMITEAPESNFSGFYVETMQDIQVPDGMGIQYYWKMLDQHVEGTGFDYSPGFSDIRGVYSENKAPRLKNNTSGLNLAASYASISFEYGMGWQTQFVNSPTSVTQATLQIIIDNTDVATKAGIKAILDPWLASLPVPRPALNLTTDSDQVNTIVDNTGTVTQEALDDVGGTEG